MTGLAKPSKPLEQERCQWTVSVICSKGEREPFKKTQRTPVLPFLLLSS